MWAHRCRCSHVCAAVLSVCRLCARTLCVSSSGVFVFTGTYIFSVLTCLSSQLFSFVLPGRCAGSMVIIYGATTIPIMRGHCGAARTCHALWRHRFYICSVVLCCTLRSMSVCRPPTLPHLVADARCGAIAGGVSVPLVHRIAHLVCGNIPPCHTMCVHQWCLALSLHCHVSQCCCSCGYCIFSGSVDSLLPCLARWVR